MNSYLVQYEVKTITTEKSIIIAETVDDAIKEALKKDNVIKVVKINKLGVPPLPSLRKPSRHPAVEMAKLYTELDHTDDPTERALIIAELDRIKNRGD
jgi:tRNA A37 threonylcarbamoyltransferase TsaD